MKNIFEEWRLLDEQIESGNDYVGKNVLIDSRFDIFIKKDRKNNLSMAILCGDDKNRTLDIEMYGIVINQSIDSNIDDSKKSIIIKNTNPVNNDIFMAFSATLYENAIINDNDDIEDIIKMTLNTYRDYFKGTSSNLSDLEQQGLFGELSYILENIESNECIVNNWEGINKNKHDFVFGDESIEIKTTRNQTSLDIKISNENQLDNSYVKSLKLIVYRLEKVNVGLTVYDLYQQILKLINKKYINEFKAKIIKIGLNVNEIDYLSKYRLVDRYTFDVDDEFPKITKKDINDRVHEVKYSINIDGLESAMMSYEN